MTKSFEEMAAREQRKIANAKLHKERLEKEKIEKEAFEKKKKFVDAVTAKLDNRFNIYCDSQNTVSFYFKAVTLKDLNWIGEMLGTENVSVVIYMEAALIVVSDICLDKESAEMFKSTEAGSLLSSIDKE